MKISIVHATKYIKDALILDDVNLEFNSGSIYGLQGPNGSGKTMLMRLISGLIRPTKGRIFIEEQELGKDIDFPNSIGILIENPSFLPEYTGLQNLKLLADLKGTISHVDVCKSIRDVGLDPNDVRKYRKYSLGMKQRLGIAAAIMEKPDLLLLDEPTNALDDEGVHLICNLIRRERDRGAIVIISCHDKLLLESLSDEVITVSNGRFSQKAEKAHGIIYSESLLE